MDKGDATPLLLTEVPGPASRAWIDRLAVRECPAITARRSRRASALGAVDDDPIVWRSAVGSNVTDVDGNRALDVSGSYGVNVAGYDVYKRCVAEGMGAMVRVRVSPNPNRNASDR